MKPGTRIHHKWDGRTGTVTGLTEHPNPFSREGIVAWDNGGTDTLPTGVLVPTKGT